MKREPLPTAGVIGAGFGGLALAIRLQAAGIATTVFERHAVAGGRAGVWRDRGFVFDLGPTVITDPGALDALFALAGRRRSEAIELLPIDPYYRLGWHDGDVFDHTADLSALRDQIAHRSPRDVDGHERLLAHARQALHHGYCTLGADPLTDWRRLARAAPQILRLSAWRSVHDVVAGFIADERLRQAFSFHTLLIGGNPFEASALYTLIHALEREWGVWAARGGTAALVSALADLFVSLGGTLHTGQACISIATEGDRAVGVTTEDGTVHRFDTIASNADVVHTYAQLLAHHPRGRSEALRLRAQRHSPSLFVVHFGLRGAGPPLARHTVELAPDWRASMDRVFGQRPHDTQAPVSMYLHSPSGTDPSLAPTGHSTHYVLAPVPHLGHAPLDWGVEGPRLRERLFDRLEARWIPDLRRRLVTCRCFTPEDFRTRLHAHLGSAFSLEPLLTQSAVFRPRHRDARIANLFLVGAGTHPGAGIPGVLASAQAVAGLITRDLSTGRAVGAAR